MANEHFTTDLPKGIERVIFWVDDDGRDVVAARRGDPDKGWVVSGKENPVTPTELSSLIGGHRTYILQREEEYKKPSTPEEWEKAKQAAHILVEATPGGWKATVVTPGVHWWGSIDLYRYPKRENYDYYSHRDQAKAIKAAQQGLNFVREYFERSKGNKVLP